MSTIKRTTTRKKPARRPLVSPKKTVKVIQDIEAAEDKINSLRNQHAKDLSSVGALASAALNDLLRRVNACDVTPEDHFLLREFALHESLSQILFARVSPNGQEQYKRRLHRTSYPY